MHGHWLKGYLREGKEIEGGGSGGALIVNLTGPRMTADKTFGEIGEALAAGRPVYACVQVSNGPFSRTAYMPIYICDEASAGSGAPVWYCCYFDYGNIGDSPVVYSKNPVSATSEDYPYFTSPV